MTDIMEKNRILFVEQTSDGTIGGSHYCLLYLVQRLNRRKYEPIVAFYEPNALLDQFKKEVETILIKKMRYLRLNNAFLRKTLNFMITVRFILDCISFLKKRKITLIHLNNTVDVGYDTWLIAALLMGIPCITHERAFIRFNKSRLSPFKLLAGKYKKLLAVSNVIRDNLIDQGFDPKLVETVYDGIDDEKYSKRVTKSRDDVLSEFGIDPNHFIIGLIGNIREWKGQEVLVDSLNILNDTVPNFTCLLVGEVSQHSNIDAIFKERLKNKINQYGLSKKVVFTGYRSDVSDITNCLDVQINASIEPDPFPHVILEGMSLGKVIIATNLGGAIESIDDGHSGFLIPAGNPRLLADKIKLVLLDNELRDNMSKYARRKVLDFSIEKNVRKIEQIYADILCEIK